MRLLNRDGYDRTGKRLYFKDAPSAPATPDYTGAAQATAAGNVDAARVATKANRVNTYTPYGNITYSQDPNDQDVWSANVSLDPSQKQLLDQQNQTSLNLAGLQNSAFNRVQNTLDQPYADTYKAQDYTSLIDNANKQLLARLNPQYDQQQSQLDQKLANQGITMGSEAWRNAQNQFGQTRNDAQTQAALQAIQLGQQQAQLDMAQQGQQFNQETTNRNAPLNELSAIRTGSQVTNPSQINNAQQQTTQGANYLGAAQAQGQADQNIYNQQISANNSGLSSIVGGLGSLGMGAAYYF